MCTGSIARVRGVIFASILVHIHTPSAGIGIYQDRHRAVVYGRQGAGNDGKRRHDDFIAGLQPKTSCRHLEGDRAVAHGYAMAPAAITRPLLFEFFNKSACRGNPAGAYTYSERTPTRVPKSGSFTGIITFVRILSVNQLPI